MLPGVHVSKEAFGTEIEEAFSHHNIPLSFYCVCCEQHCNDGGLHFHVSTCAARRHRWPALAKFLRDRGFLTNFRPFRSYLSSYSYSTKTDPNPYLSAGHPPITSKPSLLESTTTDNNEETGQSCRIRRLSDISSWIVAKRLRTERAFLAAAHQEKRVKEYILNQKEPVKSLLARVWAMGDAAQEATLGNQSRLDKLHKAAQADCLCDGVTETALMEILARNGVQISRFSSAIINLLKAGRSRNWNLAIAGPSGCAKTYLVRHLSEIYRTCSLSSGSYPLAILLDKDVELFILDDFRYHPRQTGFALCDALPFFEGKEEITIALPKSSTKCDATYKNDAPVIITVPGRFNCKDLSPDDNEMLNQRFRWLYLTNPIDISCRKDLPGCGACFAKTILSNNSPTDA